MLSQLNASQRLAVETVDGPVMVMAGAGSGKTRVLTERISYIIDQCGISPYSILAVTFTNKAAGEMKSRIANQISIDPKYMWISTFHSFCSRLLRLEITGRLKKYDSNFVIIDEDDALKIVRDLLKELSIDEIKPKKIRELISKEKNSMHLFIKDLTLKSIFERVSHSYEQYLEEHNMLDFDDLIIKTIELFKKNPDLLEKYQEKFQYILVDEFQDTNELQYRLIYMLANRYQNLFVVGDDFQSIYSFRGAKIENINQFRKDFPAHRLILLEQNYRSTTPILELANDIIAHNPNQIKKVMFTDKKEGALPFYYQASNEKSEAQFVVDKIKKYHIDGDDYADFAVLYRTNYISRVFEDTFIKNQIPYVIYGGLSFFSRKEIKDMVAYLRLLIHPEDDFSFIRIVNEPKRKIGDSILEKLHQHAAEQQCSLYDSIPSFNASGVGVKSLKSFYEMIESIKAQLDNLPLKNIIDVLLEETGYKAMLAVDDVEHERIGNIFELKNVLQETDDNVQGTAAEKLSSLLNDLSLRTDQDKNPDSDAVVLTTYHQVKGLEFKNVFMVAMEEGIFPSEYHIDDLDIEEERRICYVGITRAKERLYLSSAATRTLYGRSDYTDPSRFIDEMGTKHLKNITSHVAPIKKFKLEEKPVLLKTTSEAYRVGDKVLHNVFGKGIIVSMDERSLKVAFASPFGIKTLLKGHPSYQKIEN